MNKDKGSKNHKKAPASKADGKTKVLSSYKQEGKSKETSLVAFAPKIDPKAEGKDKKQ
jgi:hypothetical protein